MTAPPSPVDRYCHGVPRTEPDSTEPGPGTAGARLTRTEARLTRAEGPPAVRRGAVNRASPGRAAGCRGPAASPPAPSAPGRPVTSPRRPSRDYPGPASDAFVASEGRSDD